MLAAVVEVDDPMGAICRFDRPPDVRLAELAERQHGVAHYEQLRRLGLSPDAIGHRARSGRLHRQHRGVYAVGRKSVPREGHWLAAVLASGPAALLSHLSAAALWGLVRDSRAVIDVTVPGRTRRGTEGIVVHNVRRLHADDGTRREGIPVTSVARTLLDVAAVVPAGRLARAIDEATSCASSICGRSRMS